MSASLGQIFSSASASPIRQLHLQLPPAVPTISAYQGPAPFDHLSAAVAGDHFTTPTGDAHRIPKVDGSCDCPPAPKKPRPSTFAVPACRRRLIQGDLLSVPADEVERMFGRTWTRTSLMSPVAAAAANPATSVAGPAVLRPLSPAVAAISVTGVAGPTVLLAKKRRRCYTELSA